MAAVAIVLAVSGSLVLKGNAVITGNTNAGGKGSGIAIAPEGTVKLSERQSGGAGELRYLR
jgi:hypothetical protein